MQLVKQNFNELCHVIRSLMSCKSLYQLLWLGTNSFNFKINKRILCSALSKSGTLGKRKLSEVPFPQITEARPPTFVQPLLFKSWLPTQEGARQFGDHTARLLGNTNIKWQQKGLNDSNNSSQYFRSNIEFNRLDLWEEIKPSVFLIYKDNGFLGIDHWPKASC